MKRDRDYLRPLYIQLPLGRSILQTDCLGITLAVILHWRLTLQVRTDKTQSGTMTCTFCEALDWVQVLERLDPEMIDAATCGKGIFQVTSVEYSTFYLAERHAFKTLRPQTFVMLE